VAYETPLISVGSTSDTSASLRSATYKAFLARASQFLLCSVGVSNIPFSCPDANGTGAGPKKSFINDSGGIVAPQTPGSVEATRRSR